MKRTIPAAAAALVTIASLSTALRASAPQTWDYPGRAAATSPSASMPAGTAQTITTETGEARADGVAIREGGVLGLSIPLREIYPGTTKVVAPPILWSVGADLTGNIFVGTGNTGEVIRIDSKGAASSYADTEELGVRALAAGERGDMYLATFPAGGVYKITSSGSAEPWFDTEDRYIWALAYDPLGGLYVATGDRGIIYRVTGKNEGKPFFDSTQTHITALALDPSGALLAGTATGGLLHRFSHDGVGKVLLESGLSEISAIAASPSGTIYAAAIGEEQIQTPRKPGEKSDMMIEVTPAADGSALEEPSDLPRKITIDLADLIPAAGAAVAGTMTRIYRLEPNRAADLVWKSDTERVYSMTYSRERGLLFGTGGRSAGGRIYRLEEDGSATLLHQLREAQVTSLLSQPGGRVYACTSNPARVHLIDTGSTDSGSYISAVADAGHTARWGAIVWDAEIPAGTRLELRTRSGDRPAPDASWSAWSPPYAAEKGSSIASPGSRYLQWKADLSRLKPDVTPLLRSVRITLLPQNRSPTVTGLTVLAPATPLPPGRSQPNAGATTPATPAASSPADKSPVIPPKGARWVTWNPGDPDGDVVTAALWTRQRSPASGEFAVLAAGLTASPYALDDSKMAEGVWEIRIEVDDGATNGTSRQLKDTDMLVSYVVDHTPPAVEMRRPADSDGSAPMEVAATDTTGTIAKGEYALDAAAGPWNPLPCKDGICDTPTELFRLDLPDSAKSLDVTLRITDSAGNSATIEVPARDRKETR